MFKIESYVTPILLSYVDKYVRDFNPANAQVSLWGGGVALHNLVLKPDVLQQEVALPFTLISGRIHELLIQVPWTKIMSEPIVVTIDTIECVLNLKPPESPDGSPPPPPSRKTQVVEAPPGYMQALVRRIVNNIALKVHHLIVKYVQDDIVLSLNVKHLSIDSAGVNWEPSFADIDQYQPTVRRLVKLDDLTLCLDKADSDGKIRYYQEPLLYRCHLDLRVLTQLVSANCRRASSLNVTLRSSKLAFSVTSDQLTLLLRLMKERVPSELTQQPTVAKMNLTSQPELPITTKTNSAESSRSTNSWSEWAWSWLPTWMDKEGGFEDIPVSPTPLPIYFDAFLDDLSLVFKVMEVVEGLSRKRSRSVMEVGASHAVVKSSICYPTSMTLRFGARDLLLRSHGKCVCGASNYDASINQATKYIKRIDVDETEGPWTWPKEVLSEPSITSTKVEEAQAVGEEYRPTPEGVPNSTAEIIDRSRSSNHKEEPKETAEDYDVFSKMRPLIYVEFLHERAPPSPFINPYDNPPKDFQYSDWVEQCRIKVKLEPIELRLCMGLLHRFLAIRSIFKEVETEEIESATRVLTVEECEALIDNLPERRITFEARGLRFRLYPWNHYFTSKPIKSPIVLGIELPNVAVTTTAPLYPHRVCSAACQIPEDVGPLWQGARVHINAVIKEAQMLLTTVDNTLQKPCARADIHLVVHVLLKRSYFQKKESVHMSFLMKIRELNISGSWARLQAAYCAVESLISDKVSLVLKYSSLAKDALHDEDAVVLDFTIEEFIARGYVTKNIRTFIVSVHSARATAFHEPVPGEVKQAWLFSAPDAPSTTPYLRIAFQWCDVPGPTYFDYLGFWAEATAVSIDPLLIAWLAYEPVMKPVDLASSSFTNVPRGSVQYFAKRKFSWPGGAGGRGNKGGSSAELVHVRPRASADSSSEPSDKKRSRFAMPSKYWWHGEKLLAIHQRLRTMLIHVEMGLIQVYITTSTVSAVDCVTLRDAMERHAIGAQRVLAISLGRIAMHSNSANKHLWQQLRHDGPTFVRQKPEAESFPWKISIADVSCYTLEAARIERDHSGSALRSTLKAQAGFVHPRTVLELVTTTITVSVVTKMLQIKNIELIPEHKRDTSATTQTERAQKTKFFTSGLEFKPTTLKEFFRGPQRRSQRQEKHLTEESKSESIAQPQSEAREKVTVKEGPVVSLGVHLHADTPPIIIKLEKDQIHSVAAAIHGFRHISMLIKRDGDDSEENKGSQYNTLGGQSSSYRSYIPRSASEQDQNQTLSEDSPSKSSELIEIFDRDQEAPKKRLTTFLMCQWVVSHATVIVSSGTVKLAFDVDDIISTLDLQPHYNQLKIKVASAAIRHYELNENDEWVPGVMGGRVLEARETTGGKDEDQFLAVTITQAQFDGQPINVNDTPTSLEMEVGDTIEVYQQQTGGFMPLVISLLPDSWKQELHPKLLENKDGDDVMWEIFATLAPLEAIIQPVILDNVVTLIKEIMPRAFCPMKVELQKKSSTIRWPFCYLSAGGVRVLITAALQDVDTDEDDTFVFTIDKVSINPHPDNPICRRVVNAGDSGWIGTASNYEGRQYEITVKTIELRSARFKLLLEEETGDIDKNSSNPAVKWNQSIEEVILTPLLNPVDVCFVLAPPLFTRDLLTCGPALEVNILTDCVIEVSVEQIVLSKNLYAEMQAGIAKREIKVELFFEHETSSVCPYAELLKITKVASFDSDNTVITQEDAELVIDSGVETIASQSTSKFRTSFADDVPLKKSVSIVLADLASLPSDNLEVFLTMGTLELSLYVKDDNSPEVRPLRVPFAQKKPDVPHHTHMMPSQMKKPPSKADLEEKNSITSSRSITDNIRAEKEVAQTELKHFKNKKDKMSEGSLPLLHATLQQPNLYYWKRKDATNLQLSLFDAHAGLGIGPVEGHWNAVLISTAKGLPDPVTDIPPALATLNIVAPNTSSQSSAATGHKGTVKLDVERPIQLDICADSFKRLNSIYNLLMNKIFEEDDFDFVPKQHHDHSAMYKIQQFLVHENIESITVHTSQMALSGSEGSLGWSGMSCQIGVCSRPQRMTARTLVSALVVASGPSTDQRHVLLQPLMLGSEIDATWEAWRRAEGGPSSYDPTISISVEMGRVIVDLRPSEINTLHQLRISMEEVLLYNKELRNSNQFSATKLRSALSRSSMRHSSTSSDTDSNNHYYQDDLRSGAFKILTGGQLPMAYQIMLRGNAVSWRYPHPRAITRIIAFPLPGMDNETDCVLELFIAILGVWEPHTYFKIPVGEPREINLQCRPPDAVFATMWRFRTCDRPEPQSEPYEFQAEKFIPQPNPLVTTVIDEQTPKTVRGVTAEQLSGVLRVDSYFAPQVLPRIKFIVRVADTEVHIHNKIPSLTSQATAMEGYYVSRPLMRSHRVLSLFGRNSKYHIRLGAPSGSLIVVNTALSADVLDCATGTMEELVYEFLLQAAVTGGIGLNPRMRIAASTVEVGLYVSRLRTLQALALNWNEAISEYLNETSSSSDIITAEERSSQELAAETTLALEGRVSLWIHNTCTSALRIGQEGSDEVVPLGPGVRLAYRWRCPTSPKRLRLALADPTTHWHWSGSLSFTPGSTRVRLEDPTLEEKEVSTRGLGIYVHVKVEESGGNKYMQLGGRLSLANMLRLRLLYKVRARTEEAGQWRTMCSDEMEAEHVGRSVLCAADAEMVLKIKFVNHDTGWSGDIPLKECPKENVPWLVKVPSEGDMQYISVWCRIVRARSDGRIIATVWPLYVLHSHLPLDTDVLIVTEKVRSPIPTEEQLAPLIQSTPGRGNCTHLLAPGTTANKHSLSFQYRNIQCPVTREAVPLHYGVTDVSVFDKRTPVMHIDEVIQDIMKWLKRAGRTFPSTWPYSLVSKHYTGTWQAALMQPRCDVTIRYQAIRAGGGCSLEVQLCPVVLLCNAAPLALTLRAHDAAPLCVLKSGTAISPPSAILTKPFFMSVEIGRETFVSEQLLVSSEEPGRYGKLPAGHVSLDHAAHFSVLCNQKVALLTMYYEIKEDINVLGITSTYVIINRLNTDLQVSAIAVPSSVEEVHNLRANTFKVVKPTKPGSINGTSLCRFYLRGRWRGGNPNELHKFVCLALSSDNYTANTPVPVRLGEPPIRRAVALVNEKHISIPVIVSQIQHDSRCLIVVAHDTCPQFLVHNLTHMPISVAQPSPQTQEQASTSKVILSEECPGAHWWCVVPPDVALHYSTPAYCLRYPPQPPTSAQAIIPSVTVLSFGKLIEDSLRTYHEWSAPVAITSGEHLLQFYGGVTIKLCVETHPHSTLLMLKDTDERDLSASDIRRRLFGAVGSSPSLLDIHMPRASEEIRRSLERVNAVSRLFEAPREYDIPNYAKDKMNEVDKTDQPHSSGTISGTATTDIYPKISQKENEPPKTSPASSPKTSLQISPKSSPKTSPTATPAGSPNTSLKELKVKQSQDTEYTSAGPSQTGSQEKIRILPVHIPLNRQEENFSLHSEEAKTEDKPSLEPLKVEPTGSEENKMMETQENSSAKVRERESSITTNPDIEDEKPESTNVVAFTEPGTSTNKELDFKLKRRRRNPKIDRSDINLSRAELAFHSEQSDVEMDNSSLAESESLRCVVSGFVIKMAANAGEPALIALNLDRSAVLIINDKEKTRLIVAIADVQIDNLQYETGQYDFAVVATTRAFPLVADPWPALWNMFADKVAFSTRYKDASVMVKVHVDKWTVVSHRHKEITELEILLGSLALYVEDAYVSSILDLLRLAIPTASVDTDNHIPEERSLQRPLRLKLLYIHPLNLTLTLHTAVRMYIALDQSPLQLSAFKLHDMMTSAERLTHALTVHYLSAAILGAGWVVGGLELLGAPGAIAARLGEATGGVKGVASATAAALLRSLSAWAGSLARNLDLLAGDEEHARRAAAARRRLPTNFLAGLVAGMTNFAINILGAVGGLAHHPLVGVAVGETDSSTVALRRGLLGALTKPLSATADLVAYAGHGLLRQTGWDPVLQPRSRRRSEENRETAGWRRDCVRWTFRLAELHALSGFEVMLDNSPLQLLITHKYLVVADPVTERIVEMIDLKSCTLSPYHGQIVELSVTHSRKSTSKAAEGRGPDEDDEYQISAAAMARVARYTGAEGAPSQSEVRVLSLLTQPGRDHSLYAILATVLHQDPETHLSIL